MDNVKMIFLKKKKKRARKSYFQNIKNKKVLNLNWNKRMSKID